MSRYNRENPDSKVSHDWVSAAGKFKVNPAYITAAYVDTLCYPDAPSFYEQMQNDAMVQDKLVNMHKNTSRKH